MGIYYDYLKTVVETSLNHFLEDTDFPYTVAGGGKGGFGGGMMGEFPDGELPEGMPDFKGNGGRDGAGRDGPGGELPDFAGGGGVDFHNIDGIDRVETTGGITLSGTYETVQDYIDALNKEAEWVAYNSETNTVTVTSIADFVCALKPASKNLGAFDDLDKTYGENILFGDGDGKGDHFDAILTELPAGTEYEAAFAENPARTDALGNPAKSNGTRKHPDSEETYAQKA